MIDSVSVTVIGFGIYMRTFRPGGDVLYFTTFYCWDYNQPSHMHMPLNLPTFLFFIHTYMHATLTIPSSSSYLQHGIA